MSIAPPRPPTWPSPHQPGRARLWSWPALIAAGAGGAAVAATIATVITAQVAGSHPARTASPAAPAATVTVTPTPPPGPAPLPAAQADQRTCQAWHATNDLIVAGAVAQSVIPQGMTITDPAVRANPSWAAGVQKAADLYS